MDYQNPHPLGPARFLEGPGIRSTKFQKRLILAKMRHWDLTFSGAFDKCKRPMGGFHQGIMVLRNRGGLAGFKARIC